MRLPSDFKINMFNDINALFEEKITPRSRKDPKESEKYLNGLEMSQKNAEESKERERTRKDSKGSESIPKTNPKRASD